MRQVGRRFLADASRFRLADKPRPMRHVGRIETLAIFVFATRRACREPAATHATCVAYRDVGHFRFLSRDAPAENQPRHMRHAWRIETFTSEKNGQRGKHFEDGQLAPDETDHKQFRFSKSLGRRAPPALSAVVAAKLADTTAGHYRSNLHAEHEQYNTSAAFVGRGYNRSVTSLKEICIMATVNLEPLTVAVPLWEDPPGVFRVGNSRVLLELVLRAFKRGETPEGIVRSYRSLDLRDVYAVIARYLADSAPFDDYLRRCEAEADEIERKADASARPRISKDELLARAKAKGLLP